jgi:hypothetical protein
MADEVVTTEEVPAAKSKEEMRGEPHSYQDNNGWCSVCGRSEGWRVHESAEPTSAPAEEKPTE